VEGTNDRNPSQSSGKNSSESTKSDDTEIVREQMATAAGIGHIGLRGILDGDPKGGVTIIAFQTQRKEK